MKRRAARERAGRHERVLRRACACVRGHARARGQPDVDEGRPRPRGRAGGRGQAHRGARRRSSPRLVFAAGARARAGRRERVQRLPAVCAHAAAGVGRDGRRAGRSSPRYARTSCSRGRTACATATSSASSSSASAVFVLSGAPARGRAAGAARDRAASRAATPPDAIARLRGAHREAARARTPASRACRVLLEIQHRPLMTIAGEHFMNDALAVCGAENVFAATARRGARGPVGAADGARSGGHRRRGRRRRTSRRSATAGASTPTLARGEGEARSST